MVTEEERANVDFFNDPESVERYQRSDLKVGEQRLLPKYFDEPGRLLELGCGAGRVTPFLSELGHDVVAFDVAPKMVQQAASHHPDEQFQIMDAGCLAFAADSFDYCFFSFNGIDYLHPESRRHRALEEIGRILKPGGVFIYSSHNRFSIPLRPWKWPQFVRTEVLSGNVFRTYRKRGSDGELFTYHTNPVAERRRLEEFGFDVITVQDPKNTYRKMLSQTLYYVTVKERQ